MTLCWKFMAASNVVTDGHMEISKITTSGRFKNLCSTFYARYACTYKFMLLAIEREWRRKWETIRGRSSIKDSLFYSLCLARYEFTSVHVTVHLLIKHTISAFSPPALSRGWQHQHKEPWKSVCMKIEIIWYDFSADSESIYCEAHKRKGWNDFISVPSCPTVKSCRLFVFIDAFSLTLPCPDVYRCTYDGEEEEKTVQNP